MVSLTLTKQPELAGSILQSSTWGTEDLSSNNDNLTSEDLLDFASGSTLDGVAQAWLWSNPEHSFPSAGRE